MKPKIWKLEDRRAETVRELRRWICTFRDLGASISLIAKTVNKTRATVLYHLRVCGYEAAR